MVSQSALEARQTTWLRDAHHITPAEFHDSPPWVQEEIMAAWARYWRQECEEGRGLPTAEPAPRRGYARRAA